MKSIKLCILSMITRGTLSSIKDSLVAKLSAIKSRVRTVYWLYFLAGCAAHHGRYRDLKWSLTVRFICVPLSPDFRNFETTSKPGVVALLTRVNARETHSRTCRSAHTNDEIKN